MKTERKLIEKIKTKKKENYSSPWSVDRVKHRDNNLFGKLKVKQRLVFKCNEERPWFIKSYSTKTSRESIRHVRQTDFLRSGTTLFMFQLTLI